MDKENKILEGIVMICLIIPSLVITFGAKKDPLASMFIFFLCLAVGLEIRAVVERNKAKKKTFNGGKLYNPYRPFTVLSIIFALLLAILKILEAAGVINL